MILVDAYHWGVDNDSYNDIVIYGPFINHVHIATYTSRRPPGLEKCDFSLFFSALKDANYNGRISVEARWDDFVSTAPLVYEALRELVEVK